jgi:hypothetical protein
LPISTSALPSKVSLGGREVTLIAPPEVFSP